MVQKRIHIFVTGRVQGVFFRQSTKVMAIKNNVRGWVRNLDDGRVEIIGCLLYTSPSPRDRTRSRMPSSA